MNCKDKLFHHHQFDVNLKKRKQRIKKNNLKNPLKSEIHISTVQKRKKRNSQSKIEDKQKFILAVKGYLSCFIQWLCKIVDLHIDIDKDYVLYSEFPFFRKFSDNMDLHKTNGFM